MTTQTRGTEMAEVRYRVVLDDDYDPEGSWALDSDEETQAAVAEERAELESGAYVVVGTIVEQRCDLGEWHVVESLWGTVVKTTPAIQDAIFDCLTFTRPDEIGDDYLASVAIDLTP